MKKLLLFFLCTIGFLHAKPQHEEDTVVPQKIHAHETQSSNVDPQICREAQQDIISEAKGMVFDPVFLNKQREALEQCRKAGLLLQY